MNGSTLATYSVTVTDAAGAAAKGSYAFIQQPGRFQLSLDETDVTCHNGSDGTITSYRITGGTDAQLTVNSPYSIVNYAAPARFGPASYNLTGQVVYIPDNSGSFLGCSPFAPGSLTGKIALIDRGGTAPCSFVSKVQNAQDAGAIGVIIANNQPGNISAFTGTSSTITIPSMMITQDDGAALKAVLANAQVANVTMESRPIQYLWSNGATTPNLTGVGAGNYSLTMTDLWGCTVSSSIALNNPPALNLEVSGTNLTCNSSNNGTAAVKVTGGNNKCTIRNSGLDLALGGRNIGAWLLRGNTLFFTAGQSFIACNTGFVSSVKVYLFGNQRPAYKMPFKMAAGNNTTADFYSQMVTAPGTDGFWTIELATPYPVIAGNTYSFSLGGPGSDTAVIIPGFSIPAVSVWFSSVNYPGGSSFSETLPPPTPSPTPPPPPPDLAFDIKIDVAPAPPYTYLWSNGATTSSINGLSAGNYSVTATDFKGCTKSASINVTQPDVLSINAGPNKIVYKGFPDSACTRLQASVPTGGTAPFTLTWSNGSHASFIDVCPEKTTTYSLTVTDANGCTATDEVTVCVLDVRCGNKMDKVSVSHRTGSAKNPFVTLCVDIAGAKDHFKNHPEDQLGLYGMIKVCGGTSDPLFNTTRNSTNEAMQNAFEDLAVYPNPSAGQTTIRFKTPAIDQVSIKLIDMSGREIAKLYTGATNAGVTYTVPVNVPSLKSGIYLVVMNTKDGKIQTKRLILNK
jgi:hypothetical protein